MLESQAFLAAAFAALDFLPWVLTFFTLFLCRAVLSSLNEPPYNAWFAWVMELGLTHFGTLNNERQYARKSLRSHLK